MQARASRASGAHAEVAHKSESEPCPPHGPHILDLPDDVLLVIFKRLGRHSCANVCKAFRRVYIDNATGVALRRCFGRVADSGLHAIACCARLERLDVSALAVSQPWPTAALTQLRSLKVPAGWPLEQIAGTLGELAVVHSEQLPSVVRLRAEQCAWLDRVVARLDAERSGCVVHVEPAARAGRPEAEGWHGWHAPRLRLRRLSVEGQCMRGWTAPDGASLAELQHLEVVEDAAPLRALDGRAFPHLRTLRLVSCPAITSLHGLSAASVPYLDTLTLEHCDHLTSLSFEQALPAHPDSTLPRGALPRLRFFEVRCCIRLASLDGLQGADLVSVSVGACPALRCLRGVSGTPLQCLLLSGCVGLTSMQTLNAASLPRLTKLKLERCGVRTLDGLAGACISTPWTLEIAFCDELRDLRGLGGGFLREVRVEHCRALEAFGGAEAAVLPALRRLSVYCCNALAHLRGLDARSAPALAAVTLVGNPLLQTLEGLDCARLREVSVRGCEMLSLGAVQSLPSVKSLHVVDCARLASACGVGVAC